MGRSLEEVIAALPDERKARVEARFGELMQEVENLGELRRVTGLAQSSIAEKLNIKQPSVSKLEQQSDMYLSTLKNYVEAVGGRLDLIVQLPGREPVRVEKLGDITGFGESKVRRDRVVVARRPRGKAAA